jgi:adenosylmethionine-8-amino-7-oxononanoate aminotransferase
VETVQVPHDSLEATEAAIEAAGAANVAAIFVEPVIGAGGVYPPLPGYIEGLHALCQRTGVLLVCDSVICGFGRLGTWFGIERFGVTPDMIVFAKGVTSGYLPLGGVIISDEIAEPFWRSPGGPVFRHGPTYAAHATCCAAAIANIKLLSADGLVERARTLEQPLFDALNAFADRDVVAEVRGGLGLLGAVEFAADVLDADPGAPGKVAAAARSRGVLIRPLGRGVAVSPPLTVQTDHIEQIADAIDHGLSAL